jgi:hypothetical protein
MDESSYEEKLEKKLIKSFKETFHLKMGYEPIVISRTHKDLDPSKSTLKDIKAVSLSVLKNWFKDLLPFYNDKRVKIDTNRRHHDIVQIRMIFSFVARAMGHSVTSIGHSLKKDHTTIVHYSQTLKDLLETNIAYREKCQQVLEYLREKSKEYDPKLLECSDQAQNNNEPAVLS